MDFNQLKETWGKSEHFTTKDSSANDALKQRIKKVTSTQWKIKKYFRFEMAIAVTAIIAFTLVVFFIDDLAPYFYKVFALVVIGSVPLNLRLLLSLKLILDIDYADKLQKNLISAKNHLKTTILAYYAVVVITVVLLALMSFWDDYFLSFPLSWQIGVMIYFALYLIFAFYSINKFYGSRLKEIEEMLEEL